MMLSLPVFCINTRFCFSLLFVSTIGFLASFGTLWDVFGWANLTVLSIPLLALFAIYNILFSPNLTICWSKFLLYVPLPLSIFSLYLFQALWAHPSFPGYPEALTNQELIRCLSYLSCFLSVPFLLPKQLNRFWIGFAFGLAAYGFGTIFLSLFSGVDLRAPFDMHFGGPWGTQSNPTPPGLAILFCTLIFSCYVLSSSFSKARLMYSLTFVYLISISSILLLNRRSSLILLLFGFISILYVLNKRPDFNFPTLFRRLSRFHQFIILLVSSSLCYFILQSRLFTKLFITFTQGPASSDSDRWDRYIQGFPLLAQSILSNNNFLIDLPPDLLVRNVHWHNSILDSFRIGGLVGLFCMIIWLFYLFKTIIFNSNVLLKLLALSCFFILMVEPSLHRTWIDSLTIQFTSIFICFPRSLFLVRNH